MELVVKPRTL